MNDDGEVISKSKGLSGKLTLKEYLELYNDNVVTVIEQRWKRDLEHSTIEIKDQPMFISPILSYCIKTLRECLRENRLIPKDNEGSVHVKVGFSLFLII